MPEAQNLKLLVAYEGTRYCGWQTQKNGPSVQDAFEEAFRRLTGCEAKSICAGRTDAGVHALGQVVCVQYPGSLDLAALRKGLNARLPEDIVVLEVEPVPAGFDARGDVRGKFYRYTIHNHPVRPLFERRLSWHLRKKLDLGAMRAASACLLGEHDFSSFRASGCEAAHPVRSIDKLAWRERPPLVQLEIWGRAFLKQMVRNIVGTCTEIGRGRMAAECLPGILESRDRRRAGPCAPACGLCLVKVYYDEEEYRREVHSQEG